MFPLILILGPTASGKSALGLHLAEKFGGGILNCDSLQAYQRLDIGSAKPLPAERQKVPHYVFDLVPPGKVLTAGAYRNHALEALAVELKTHAVFGVGGSGFYVQALEKGMFDAPKASSEFANAVRADLATQGLAALFQELKVRDPEYAAELNANDAYRILRALIIIRESGQRVSRLRADFKALATPFPYRLLKLGLAPSREELLPRVERRARAMLERGLVNEVRALRAEGFADWPPLQSVGYKETMKFLGGEIDENQLLAQIIEKTMQLAKKQKTWFKRDAAIHWLPTFNPEILAEQLVRPFLDSKA